MSDRHLNRKDLVNVFRANRVDIYESIPCHSVLLIQHILWHHLNNKLLLIIQARLISECDYIASGLHKILWQIQLDFLNVILIETCALKSIF